MGACQARIPSCTPASVGGDGGGVVAFGFECCLVQGRGLSVQRMMRFELWVSASFCSRGLSLGFRVCQSQVRSWLLEGLRFATLKPKPKPTFGIRRLGAQLLGEGGNNRVLPLKLSDFIDVACLYWVLQFL